MARRRPAQWHRSRPFAGLGLKKTRGLRDAKPPAEETVWALIRAIREKGGPSFAAWLQVAAHTGMRPGEVDALRWERVDLERGRIAVVEQWNAGSRTFTLPKNGEIRNAILTPAAREAIIAAPRESDATGHRARAPTTGTRRARRSGSRGRCTSRPATTPVGT
jgi:integrase